jgi:hypothetical protein
MLALGESWRKKRGRKENLHKTQSGGLEIIFGRRNPAATVARIALKISTWLPLIITKVFNLMLKFFLSCIVKHLCMISNICI